MGYEAAKRAIDVAFAAVLLALLAPVLIAIAAAVLVTMGWPVIFAQERTGLGGKTFTLYKFRTMRPTDARGTAAVASDAERLTRFGRFLRKTSLDELPELWNILKGDMSFVGPRPLLPEYMSRYTPQQARRHEVRPGLTGWAQVHGRNAVPWPERFAMDVWYVDNRSLALDAKIVLMTAAAVLRGGGVSADGCATMTPFEGEAPCEPEGTEC
ncbi:MAG: sugar transferase [Coriobacteriia bacterium]|nr:sugar transferase [Coriobacteriia bacterium]